MVNRRFVKYGLPFIIFVIGGSVGLSEFTQIRYKYRTQKNVGKREQIMFELDDILRQTTLETEYETMKNEDINNWENKRIPRPWEPQEDEKQKQ